MGATENEPERASATPKQQQRVECKRNVNERKRVSKKEKSTASVSADSKVDSRFLNADEKSPERRCATDDDARDASSDADADGRRLAGSETDR